MPWLIAFSHDPSDGPVFLLLSVIISQTECFQCSLGLPVPVREKLSPAHHMTFTSVDFFEQVQDEGVPAYHGKVPVPYRYVG